MSFKGGLVLTHGAGSNADAPWLRALDREFTKLGLTVVRHTLRYRQLRPKGPPRPADGAGDRAGLREELAALRVRVQGPVYLGGHSYGGRQSTMLAAEDPAVCDGLLLCSYPLHPPGKPDQKRTAHLPDLRVPAMFVHGSTDPFGTLGEMREALGLIPGRTQLRAVEGCGHDLKKADAAVIAREFQEFVCPK